MIDLSIPEEPLPLDQLIVDCRDTLKHQVKTGKGAKFLIQPCLQSKLWTPHLFLNRPMDGWVGGRYLSGASIPSLTAVSNRGAKEERGDSVQPPFFRYHRYSQGTRGANHPRTILLLRVSLPTALLKTFLPAQKGGL